MRRLVLGALAGLALLAAACSSGPVARAGSSGPGTSAGRPGATTGATTTTTAPAMSRNEAQQQYLGVLLSADGKLNDLASQASRWTGATTGSAAQAEAAPVLAAVESAVSQLLALEHGYPPVSGAMAAELRAAVALEGQLSSLGSATASVPPSWVTTFSADFQALGTAAAPVRSVLGFPASGAGF